MIVDRSNLRRRPSFGEAPVTYLLIAAAVAVVLMSWVQPGLHAELEVRLAMWNRQVAAGEWWRMFSVVLLHAGVIHIAFNGLLLYQLGIQLERQLGPIRYAVMFFSTAAVGSAFAFHLGSPNDFGVGMSGAVFGVVGVWLASGFRHRRTAQGRMILDQLTGLVILNAIVPFVFPAVSWQAHLGGLVAGMAVGQMWSAFGRSSGNVKVLQIISGVGVAVLAVISTQL